MMLELDSGFLTKVLSAIEEHAAHQREHGDKEISNQLDMMAKAVRQLGMETIHGPLEGYFFKEVIGGRKRIVELRLRPLQIGQTEEK